MNTQPPTTQSQRNATTTVGKSQSPAIDRMVNKSYRAYKRVSYTPHTGIHNKPGRPSVYLSPSDIADRFAEFPPSQRFTTREIAEVLGVSPGRILHRRAARTFADPSYIEQTAKGRTTIYYTAGDIVAWGRMPRDSWTGKRKGGRAVPRKFNFKKIHTVFAEMDPCRELSLQDISELSDTPHDMLLYRARKKLFAPVHRIERDSKCLEATKYYLASDVAAWALSYLNGGTSNQGWQREKIEVRSLFASYCDVNNVGKKCNYNSSNGVVVNHMGTEISALYDMAFSAYNSMLIDFGVKRAVLDSMIERWRKDGLTEKKIYGRLIWINKECSSTRKRKYLDPADVIDWETDDMNIFVGKED